MGRLSGWIDRSGAALLSALVIAAGGCGRPESPARVVSRTAAGQSTSPAGTEAAHEGKSLVRLVNALPGAPAVNVTVDDSVLFARVTARAVTPYREIRDNVVTIRMTTANDRTVAERTETMTDGFRYTLIALPEEKAGITLRVLHDEVVPDVGKARIRFINAAPNVESADLAVRGADDPLLADVGRGKLAGYRDIDPVSSMLEVRSHDGRGRPVKIPNLRLVAGKAYTVVLVESSDGRLETITFDDSVSGAKLSLREEPTR